MAAPARQQEAEMKSTGNRKTLIVAVFSVLAVVIAINTFTQFRAMQALNPQAEQPKPAEKEVAKRDVSASEKAGIADRLKGRLAGRSEGPEESGGGAAKAGEIPAEPTIRLTRVRIQAQQPNDSATSSQWYQEDARLKAKAEQLDKEREAVGGN
jgi:hypothetical protein